MIYAVVHYPAVDTDRINLLRSKYDPQFHLIDPHITIVFPVTHSIGEHNLVVHIEGVLSRYSPFPIRLCGLERSHDNYLFLLFQEGVEIVKHLHSEMYTGVLASYRRTDVLFAPHVTLGRFGEDEQRYASALKEAEEMNLDYGCMFDRLHLVKVNDQQTRIVWTKDLFM